MAISFASYTRALWWGSPMVGLPEWLATRLAVGWSVSVTIGIIWLVVFLARRTGTPGGNSPGSASTSGTAPATGVGAPQPAGDLGTAGRTGEPPPRQPGHGSWRDRRPGDGFSAIVLGLALLCGAVAAGVWSGGNWSDAALLVGLSVTLGVLALGIIVSGIRGKQSGAVGGFAFLAAVPLVFLSLFPSGTVFFPVGAPVWAVNADAGSAPSGYAVLAGRATIDLTALDVAGTEARTIDVWMGVGVTELLLPNDRPVQVETNALIGGFDYVGDEVTVQQGGVFFSDSRTFNSGDAPAMARVRVWTTLGQITVIGAQEP